MKTYYVYNLKDQHIGTIETTCLKYAEKIAKEDYADYDYLTWD